MISTLRKYAPAQLVSSLSIFAIVAIHARFLDLAEYGMLALLSAALEIIRSISAQWVNNALIRLHPGAPLDEQQTFIETALGLILLLLVPSVGAIAICLYAYDLSDTQLWMLLTVLLILKSLFSYSVDVSRLNNEYNKYRKIAQTQAILSIILSWLFLSFNPTLQSAVAALAASYFAPWILFCRNSLSVRINTSAVGKIFNYGFPVLVAGGISTLGSRVDRIVIAEYLDFGAVGAYSALSNAVLGIMGLGFMLVALPIYPDLAKKTSDQKELQKKHSVYLDILLAVTLPATVGLCFVADEVFSAIITKDYLIFEPELVWMLCFAAFLFNLKGHYLDHGFQFLLQTRFQPWLSGAVLLLSIAFLLIFVPLWGALGAAAAWLVSTFISAIASFLLATRLGYKFQLGCEFPKIVFAVALMVVSLSVVRLSISPTTSFFSLAALVPVGIISYVFSLVFLNAFDFRRRFINHIFRGS